MSRRSDSILWAVAAALGLGAAVQAQPEDAPANTQTAIEQYLADRNLSELLAVYLLERLKVADNETRVKIADRLGGIYVRLLDKASTPEARSQWEARSQDLLKAVPEADSSELRLNLVKARYLQAEDLAERWRLRLITPEERQEAERTLRTAAATFQDIGTKIHRRVEVLEKKEASGRDEDAATVRADLSEARRLRSLAMYYAGWSEYYVALLSGKGNMDEPLSHFGWLLNASGGRPANVERVPPAMLKYEHVARAAIGCALCESQRGQTGTAILWLDAVESAEGLSPAVASQILSRRLAVYAQGKRWADMDYMIKKKRQPAKDKPVQPLGVGEARLLAVVTLEALDDRNQLAAAREDIQSLADLAMTDLITLGEVKHVQDLVTKYGSAHLGGEGFIVQYVRGLQTYDRARAAHAAAGTGTEEPARDDAVRNLYDEAGRSLDIAVRADDAQRFADERANAGLLLGLCSFYAGHLMQAADQFEQVFQSVPAAAASGPTAKRSEDALWLAIISLDKAVEGGTVSLKDRLARLGTLYLQKYPKSERAARLLLRQSGADLLGDEKAAAVLLAVAKDSALYEAARRQAASLLYNVYRRARGTDRDFAALRFAEVSEEILRLDAKKLNHGTDAEKLEATNQVLVRVRQLLDAVLGMTAPDLDRAEKAFQQLDDLVAGAGLDLKKVDDELTYRRLQLALARSRVDDIARHLDRLHALGGRFADAADRLMYKRALARLNVPNPPPHAALDVVRHGRRVMDQFGKDGAALADPAVYALHNAVADAAARAWRQEHDESLRSLSMAIDKALMDLGNPPVPVLRRYAELTESAGDQKGALDAWRLLVSGLNPTAPDWFEARYHSLRLLLALDPQGARSAMNQYKVLHQDLGPEPWGQKLRDLDAQIPAAKPEGSGT